MNFPHMKDNDFPYLDTADVYAFQNTFDYTRWNEDTRVKLCNVIWNSDYSDVVKFEDNSARDSYFDNLKDFYAIELSQAARIVPDNYVKLPIPYDVMARYNYLFIDMPVATSSDAPIDYEHGGGIRRWYFFIQNVSYLSPNTTQVFLELDVWTNFHNDIEINYLMLERGHAPVAYSDTDTYLENPIANTRYLLAPDVNFDNAGVIRSARMIPYGNGKKYVCFATTVSPDIFTQLGSVTESAEFAPTGTIAYSDVNARYGHQLQVDGFTMGNGYDFSNAKVPAKPGNSQDGRIANNLTVYCMDANVIYARDSTFFADVLEGCPQFLKSLQACFVVDETCIEIDTQEYDLVGYTLRECIGTHRNLARIALQKSDFAYPDEYERFAKLYTTPYAQLEVTDNAGTSYTINVEETTTLDFNAVCSTAFPYINFRMFISGVGARGNDTYTWVDLRNRVWDEEISRSDWFKYCFDMEIPTFALYMDGETAYQLESFNRTTRMGVRNALVAYHNTMRSANTANANAIDGADSAKRNVDDAADTSKTNTDASADMAYTNVDNACNTQRANVNLAIATAAANEEAGISASTAQTNLGNQNAFDNINSGNLLMTQSTSTNNETTTSTTESNNNSAIQTGALGGVMGGATAGAALGLGIGSIPGAAVGAAAGALIGAAGGLISAHFASGNATIITQAAQQLTTDTINCNVTKVNNSTQLASSTLQSDIIQRRLVYGNNNTLADNQMTNNNTNDRTNADNARNTEKANATRSQTTSKSNATRTRDVTVANSDYTREIEELNAKEILENAANAGMAAILDSRNNEPVAVCSASGNPAPDWHRTRGLQFKVKTQSDSAIRQAGDMFARYGYALNQVWDVRETGLTLMNHFTYWKASDIWVDDRQSSNNFVQSVFTEMFLRGITVWSDPTEIGRVSIYDN